MANKIIWAIYGFNNGHFSSTFCEHGMPFNIVIGCDPFANGRAFFKEICACPAILTSALAFLDHVRGSGITAPLTGYLIHLHCYTSTESMSRFWSSGKYCGAAAPDSIPCCCFCPSGPWWPIGLNHVHQPPLIGRLASDGHTCFLPGIRQFYCWIMPAHHRRAF